MSFHKHIIDTLVDQMPNATNNHYAERGRRIRIGRLTPDIVVLEGEKICEVHEVECVRNRFYPAIAKRVLWIALNGEGEWDEINVITDNGEYSNTIRGLEARAISLYRQIKRLETKISELNDKLSDLNDKLSELKIKEKYFRDEIKKLKKRLRSLRMSRYNLKRKKKSVCDMGRDRAYNIEWDLHLLEELKREIERQSNFGVSMLKDVGT